MRILCFLEGTRIKIPEDWKKRNWFHSTCNQILHKTETFIPFFRQRLSCFLSQLSLKFHMLLNGFQSEVGLLFKMTNPLLASQSPEMVECLNIILVFELFSHIKKCLFTINIDQLLNCILPLLQNGFFR